MELISNHQPKQIISKAEIIQPKESKGNFIGANTKKVSLDHLKKDCIIPVFSKDNESTISHYQFINETRNIVKQLFPDNIILRSNIRVSHQIKGRIPSAIGKPAKELLPHEKTIYYERCAFMIEIPELIKEINGNQITLTIGGVRAYNQENLYSRKSLEKFKVFIGFSNNVCTNLCISTDGFSNEIRIGSISELQQKVNELVDGYNQAVHLDNMIRLNDFFITEEQFAHLIGKCRMYQHLQKSEKNDLFSIQMNDGQINTVVRNYYLDDNFQKDSNGNINLWKLYNLFTEANKSSYIDSNLERNVNAYKFIQNLSISLEKGKYNWFLHN